MAYKADDRGELLGYVEWCEDCDIVYELFADSSIIPENLYLTRGICDDKSEASEADREASPARQLDWLGLF